MLVKKIHLLVLALFGLHLHAADTHELRWDWSTIDTDTITFNKDFIFGAAVAEPQVSGFGHDSTWSAWQYAKDAQGKSRILDGQRARLSSDFWNNYQEDIKLMQQMKLKALRFSIEWSAIEPEHGKINYDALQHYHDLCDALITAGIKPVVTLHHFAHPIWFEELGAFEKAANITYFTDFCALMMREFGDKVFMWATFNEPGFYVFQGYIRGVWPPGKKDIRLAAHVTKHILQAHVRAYKIMKDINPQASVGIVHSITQFDPHDPTNGIQRMTTYYLNHLFHDAITQFFATGNFTFSIPLMMPITYHNPQATASLDYFGINYYSHVVVGWFGKVDREEEIKTDSPYTIYPEGLYRAIKDISQRIAQPQHIPIYITENGIADAKDTHRELFIKQYLYALYTAIQNGYDVRGYFYWSLMDNFEWAEAFTMKYGLYEVDMSTQERTLRNGSKAYLRVLEQTYDK